MVAVLGTVACPGTAACPRAGPWCMRQPGCPLLCHRHRRHHHRVLPGGAQPVARGCEAVNTRTGPLMSRSGSCPSCRRSRTQLPRHSSCLHLNWFPLPVLPSSCRCDPAGPYSKQMVEKLPHLAAGWSPCCPQLRGWPGRAVPTVHRRAPAAPGGCAASPALGAPQYQGGRAPACAPPWQSRGCAGGCPGPGLQRGDVEAAGDGEHVLYCWQWQEGDRPVWGCGRPVSRNNGTFLPRSCCSPITQHLEGRMCFREP